MMESKEFRALNLSIAKIGRVVFLISLVIFFVPFLVTWFVFGTQPHWPELLSAGVTWFLINAPFWVAEPISYFPIIGMSGIFISFLAGNGANLRIPCAIAAQKAAEEEPGTEKGQVIATIGMCVSVFVSTVFLIVGTIAGQAILSAVPPSVNKALDYLLPSLYGCIFAQFVPGNGVIAVISMVIAVAILLLSGVAPIDISFLCLILPIVCAIAIAIFMDKKRTGTDTSQE